ncbi:tag-115 [Pristionchus pacificus]|nr:tag-115 [Pristionchus pacificus]
MRFSFVEDRMRAVRQDSTITRVSGNLALTVFEKQISFVIRSEYRARSERSKAFEAKLHATASEECFQRWSRLLSESESSIANDLRCQVAAAHCLKRANEPESIVMAIEYRAILGQDLFKTVFDILLSYREGNSLRFFRLISSLPDSSLLRPVCATLAPALRLATLATMAKAFKAPNIKLPLDMISSWLGYTEKDTKEFLTVAGVIVEEDCIFPMKIEQERVNKTDRNEPILIFIDF